MEPTPSAAKPVASPLGPARVVAETAIAAAGRDGEELVAQRLEVGDVALVRLGYRREGRVLRGPVSATPEELAALLKAARTDKVLPRGTKFN